MRKYIRKARDLNNDEGSLLIVILFSIVMAALSLAVMAMMMSGLEKTKSSRAYAVSLQAADTAFADALIRANLGGFGSGAPSPQSSPVNTLGVVTWQWTATRVNTQTWTIDVKAQGSGLDRNFRATLKGTQVNQGVYNTSTGTMRYAVSGTQNFEYGFFGADSFTVANTTPASLPDVDGYNGAKGTVASNGVLTLRSAIVQRIAQWNWVTDTGRCVGTACTSAPISKIKSASMFDASEITSKCLLTDGIWRASTNATKPLTAGKCYDSVIFDATITTLNVPGVVYVKTGGITVNAGVRVNISANPSGVFAGSGQASRLRFASLGPYNQSANSLVALAVFAPNAACNVTANINPPSNYATTLTLWAGAATCKTFNVTGSARLRTDGGLELVNNAGSSATSGRWVWSMLDIAVLD
jgi:hypothetical protein